MRLSEQLTAALMERGIRVPGDIEVDVSDFDRGKIQVTPEEQLAWAKWMNRVSVASDRARKEVSGWRIGPYTRQLLAVIREFTTGVVKIPAYESREEWNTWLTRIQQASMSPRDLARVLAEWEASGFISESLSHVSR